MRRRVEKIGVALEHRLRAVAVMDVEIDHGDAAQPVIGACVQAGQRHVVEQAESHRLVRLGVMAGRAHRADRVLGLAAGHGVDRGENGAGRAERGFARAGRDDRVAVDHRAAHRRDHAEDAVDEFGRMAERQEAGIGHRRLAPIERRELGRLQRLQNRGQALGPLRVALAGIMIEAGRMGKQQGGQIGLAAFPGFIPRSSVAI